MVQNWLPNSLKEENTTLNLVSFVSDLGTTGGASADHWITAPDDVQMALETSLPNCAYDDRSPHLCPEALDSAEGFLSPSQFCFLSWPHMNPSKCLPGYSMVCCSGRRTDRALSTSWQQYLLRSPMYPDAQQQLSSGRHGSSSQAWTTPSNHKLWSKMVRLVFII